MKPSLGLARRLIRPNHQITIYQILAAFKEPGGIANLLCRPLLRSKTSAILHMKVLTNETAFHRQLPLNYVDALKTFIRTI